MERAEVTSLIATIDAATKGMWFVVGELGSGKTTSLERLSRVLAAPVAPVVLPERAKSEELEACLSAAANSHPSDVVLLIDDTHRILHRHLLGLGPIRQLLTWLHQQTNERRVVASVDAYGWQLLCAMEHRPMHGPDVVWLQPWDHLDLRQLVERRMEVLGVEASFQHLDLADDRSERGDSAVGYFQLLEEAADHNPTVAMELWPQSLIARKANEVDVKLFAPTPKQLVVGLSELERFALGALVQHVELDAAELGVILGQSELNATTILAQLGARTLVEHQGGRWRIANLVYPLVVGLARAHNLVFPPGRAA